MGKIFWVEFQRCPLKFHTNILFIRWKTRGLLRSEIQELLSLRARGRFWNTEVVRVAEHITWHRKLTVVVIRPSLHGWYHGVALYARSSVRSTLYPRFVSTQKMYTKLLYLIQTRYVICKCTLVALRISHGLREIIIKYAQQDLSISVFFGDYSDRHFAHTLSSYEVVRRNFVFTLFQYP